MLEKKKEIKITDFGIAKIVEEMKKTNSQVGIVMGTPSYISPERFEGIQDDFRSDIFSVGVIMYELITGMKPYRGKSVSEIMFKILHSQYEPINKMRSSLPYFVDEIVSRAIEKDPGNRFQSAEDLKGKLQKKGPAYLIRTLSLRRLSSLWLMP